MSKKLPKVLSTISVICLLVAVVIVYGWYQDHQAEQFVVKDEEYKVSEETVVKRDESAEAVVALTVDDLKNYRDTAKERVTMIATLQNDYLPYWRQTNMTIDESVNGMLEMNATLNKYFPNQSQDTCWCDVGIENGNIVWTGYVLSGGSDKTPCLWLGYLEYQKRLLAYVYAEYDGANDVFLNSSRGETVFGNSLSSYTNDTAYLQKVDPEISFDIIPDYSMSDYKFVNEVSEILKKNGNLPDDYAYKVGDNLSDILQPFVDPMGDVDYLNPMENTEGDKK